MRVLLSLLAVVAMHPGVTLAQTLDAGVERILAGRLVTDGPGVAILVMKNGRPLLQRTSGFADIETGKKIDHRTQFDLASVSKPVTGLAVLSLVDRGKLRLDDPVTQFVPDFRVPQRGRAITIRDLLQHTSGLRDYTDGYPGDDETFAKITTELHLDWLNGTQPRRPPGRKFEYNNSNYTLLALVVERVSELSFAQYCKRTVFRRAKMRRTFVYDGQKRLPRNVADGYRVRGGRVHPSLLLTNITGDGNVYTSINELARFVVALGRSRIVRPGTLESAWTNGQLDGGRPIRDGGYGYGLGWEIQGSRRSHSGSWSGTSTYFVIDPSQELAVAVLSNDENFDSFGVGEAIWRLMAE